MLAKGNPAQRLYNLLDGLLKVEDRNANKSAEAAWREVFAPVDSAAGLMSAFSGVYALPGRIREWMPALQEADEDVAVIDAQLRIIETTLSTCGLRGQLKNYKTGLRPEVMQGLRVAAGAIRRAGGGDPEIDRSEVQKLRTDIEAFVDEIAADAALRKEVRIFALKYLSDLCKVLDEVEIYGVEALQDVVCKYVGEIVLAKSSGDDELVNFTSHDERGKRIWSYLDRAGKLMTLGLAMQGLMEGAANAIGS